MEQLSFNFSGKYQDKALLKSFMDELIPIEDLTKAGFFTKEMKGDYEAMADRICQFFGYKTVYEYGSEEFSYHATYVDGHRPSWINEKGEYESEPFLVHKKSIYR